MLVPVHVEITRAALTDVFSPRALDAIMIANTGQDALRRQIGHDEYHFDNNAFDRSFAYLEEQRRLAVSSLHAKDVLSAWSAFGRLTHTAQDFYAHTNYILLWLARFDGNPPPAPTEVDPLDLTLVNSPDLRSGKVYYLEILSYLPLLRPLVRSLLPSDSHAKMNLDSPAHSPHFDYAFYAAVKRTKIEYEKIRADISGNLLLLFTDRDS